MKTYQWLLASCLISLAACGGGGGSSAPTPPAPTPTPTPTPPPPPPPPPAPSSTTFTSGAVGAIVGFADFDVDGDGEFVGSADLRGSTNRQGEFGQDVSGKLGLGGFADEAAAEPIYAISVSGNDSASGLAYALYAPTGATTVSPITTLLYFADDPAQVRTGLALDSGTAPLRSAPDLLTFDVPRSLSSSNANERFDASRLTVINLHLLNLASLVSAAQFVDRGFPLDSFGESFADFIAQNSSAAFDDPDYIGEYLQANFDCGGSPEALEALAELVAKFGSIVPDRIDDLELAAKYSLLFRFTVTPEFRRLCAAPTGAAIAEVRAITAQEIEDQLAVFSSATPPDLSGTLFAAPDYREFQAPSLTLTARCDLPTDSQRQSPYCNDQEFGEGLDGLSLVSVTSGNSSQLSVSLASNGQITMSALNGFRGLTFFDYVVQYQNEPGVQSRVYVRIR